MNYRTGKIIVIALGGSIVHPDGINIPFLKKFRKFVLRHVTHGKKFIIVQGGGKLARIFRNAAEAVVPLDDTQKDWLGIYATHLNARLVQMIFADVAAPEVIDSCGKLKRIKYPVTIAAGWTPGWSTDYVAAALAADFHIPEIIVAGKPARVYTQNPDKHKNAKPLSEISWDKYLKLIPAKWTPGAHAPVDPVAARFAEKRKLKAVVLNGLDLKNLDNLLKNKEFEGTIVG